MNAQDEGFLNQLLVAVWRCLPASLLGDLQDARVRAIVAKTIFENQAFSIFVHLAISVCFYFSYPIVQTHWAIQSLLLLFCAIAFFRYWIQRTLRHRNLSESESIKYLVLGVGTSGMIGVCLSTISIIFLQGDDDGLYSPVIFMSLLYYFAAVIKNISVRLVNIFYSAVLLMPLAVHFFLIGDAPSVVIGIFILIMVMTMMLFGKTMQDLITSKIRQNYQLEFVTERLIQERDRADAANQSKTNFLAAASHDLRQPVHAMGLYLSTLTHKTIPDDIGAAVRGIYQSWLALDGLLGQIMELSQADSASKASLGHVHLAPLLRTVILQHAASAQMKNQRVVQLGKPHAWVIADAHMLHRVLSNLLDNAIKHGPSHSIIAVTVRARSTGWAIQVRDNGKGIAQQDHQKVFEIFVQADNPQRSRSAGYGVGLATAKRFVAAMGGILELRSEIGRGTCIGVVLSRVQGKELEPQTLTPTAVPDHADVSQPARLHLNAITRAHIVQSGKKILLVEDDPLVSDAFAQVFDMLGLPYRRVGDAEYAQSYTQQTLLAICDMRLPGKMNGLELAKHFKEQNIPAILMTGETLHYLKQQAQAAQIPCLQKPVKPQQLLDWLQTVVSC